MSTSEYSAKLGGGAGMPDTSRNAAPHEAVRCRTCGDMFPNHEELMKHKLMAMKIEKTHIHCPVCTLDFRTEEAKEKHILEMHPQEQKMICPGCQKEFARLAGWMKHLEHDECSAIRRQDVDRNRAQKLKFAHELEKRSGSQFGDYFPASHPSVQSAFNKPYMAHPSYFKPDDFPELKEVESSVQQGLRPQQAYSNKEEFDGINNPSHPDFHFGKYYNDITRKYKCPQASCKKSFDNSGALIAHMKAAVSHYNAKLQCPGCLRYFKDASSLTAHSESETRRCSIRHSENYRVYLDQLTGGMADVVGKHQDDTVRYEVSTEAIIKFGPTEQARKATEDFMAQQEAERQEHWTRNNPVW